jgi:hypothetical protein
MQTKKEVDYDDNPESFEKLQQDMIDISEK